MSGKSPMPPTDSHRDWFYGMWDESFSSEIQRIREACADELHEVSNARDLVAGTFVTLRHHMQSYMQKIVSTPGDKVGFVSDTSPLLPSQTKYMDRHKLGACVAGAFLYKTVLLRKQQDNGGLWSRRAFFANEILALKSAVHVVASFIRSGTEQHERAIDSRLLAKLQRDGFAFPQASEGGYDRHVYAALRQCYIQRRCLPDLPNGPRPPFDLFLFSTILFHIEMHNLVPVPPENLEQQGTSRAA